MLFLNPWLLLGLAGVTIPVMIHLVRQQAAKPVDWGAMRFLFDTIAVRKRRIQWEDLLLMAARCLLLALIALAIAKPFLAPDSQVPWLLVLPVGLAAIAALGSSFVLRAAWWRWSLRLLGVILLAAAVSLGFLESVRNLKRFGSTGSRDLALVIDASGSMDDRGEGGSRFERALEEAREVVRKAPRGTAFRVILGGPSPVPLTSTPLTQRADVLGVLDGLRPVGGRFRADDALALATVNLFDGIHPTKEIVVFSDDQRLGWGLDDAGGWNRLGKAWDQLPAQPKLLLRRLPSAAARTNAALSEMEFSRGFVGTDRAVGIRVTVENTGTTPVTPGRISLEINGQSVATSAVGILAPGQKEIAAFEHRFEETGPTRVRISLDLLDEFAWDNVVERVVPVRRPLRVLLVDGNANAEFFDRASGYLALALAPGAGEFAESPAVDAGGFQMDPEVVPLAQLNAQSLENRDVIVLADVPRLPRTLAAAIADQVQMGCGLLVVAGPRVDPTFYNSWVGADGELIPLELGPEMVDVAGKHIVASAMLHESMAIFRPGSDLENAGVLRWRSAAPRPHRPVAGAAFQDGEPWMAAREYSGGRTMVVAMALDARAGNLPAKRGFVPLVHEWVSWLAGSGPQLNLPATFQPSVRLAPPSGGLDAVYQENGGNRSTFSRTDPSIYFDWEEQAPAPGFSDNHFTVRWKGFLTPPTTGLYRFTAEVDDRFELQIADGPRWSFRRQGDEVGEIELVAGQPVPIVAEFTEEAGNALVQLFWEPPGMPEQPLPSGVLTPAAETTTISRLRALDPTGLARGATLRNDRRGRELIIDGTAMPGTYEVTLDDASREGRGRSWLADWSGNPLPVVVLEDAAESDPQPFTAEDDEMIRKQIDLVHTDSVTDILAVLEGKGFGRGIWRWIALAAIAFFLIEGMLARWVSRSRRIVEETGVEFGQTAAWEGRRK